MKKYLFSLKIALFVYAFSWCLHADKIPQFNARDSALNYMVHQDYKNAQKFLNIHLDQNPLDNEALYLSFVIEQTRILDYESYAGECDSVISAADSLKRLLEKRSEKLKGKSYKECLFYIANLSGGTGILHSKKGDWFEAVKCAMNSVSLLKKVKKLDPGCHEADLGMGVFDYYLSKRLKWLPFIQDKTNEGIHMLENALHARFPYNYAAKNSLCWILIENGDFRRADSLAGSVLDSLPDNTIFLRIRAYLALWSGKYDNAGSTAKHIIECAQIRDPVNWSDLINGTSILVNSLLECKDTAQAYLETYQLLNKPIPQEYLESQHLKKNIKQLNEIQKEYYPQILRSDD